MQFSKRYLWKNSYVQEIILPEQSLTVNEDILQCKNMIEFVGSSIFKPIEKRNIYQGMKNEKVSVCKYDVREDTRKKNKSEDLISKGRNGGGVFVD